jgi:hypothetical protein
LQGMGTQAPMLLVLPLYCVPALTRAPAATAGSWAACQCQ